MKMSAKLLQPGRQAPPFRLLDHWGRSVGVSDYTQGKGVILLFFTSDWLKADIALLEAYRDAYAAIRQANLEVLAVSGINWETLHTLAQRLEIPFPLVFDPCCRYANQYQVMLIPKFVNARAIYGINPQGAIVFATKKATPTEAMAAFSN